MKRSFTIITIFLSVSCVSNGDINIYDEDKNNTPFITKEEAINTLNEFLSETESDFVPTKSGEKRRILSVNSYFSREAVTKSADTIINNSSNPVAYVVNFADNEGFAVLGANKSVAPIVVVTEKGSIDASNLCVIPGQGPIIKIDNEDDGINWDEFDWYCEEDDDYYTMGMDKILTDFIRGAVDCPNPIPWPNMPVPKDIPPMLSIKWDQGEWKEESVYNKYCLKNKGTQREKNALAGCSTTALSMILAYNEYPQKLEINDTIINWGKIKERNKATMLADSYKEHVSLLFGSIFNNVFHIATSIGTLITPRQIQLLMEELGYRNLAKHNASDFTSEMFNKTHDMLSNGKPLFLSAMGSIIEKAAHSWIIDGLKYDAEKNPLLHFNLGWGGTCNGYYSLTCFNPSKAESYDTGCKPDSSYTHNGYDKRFRLITYDVPSDTLGKSLNF